MKDEAEAGLLYESQSKLMRSRRPLRWYTCTAQYSRWVQGPLLRRDMGTAGTKPLGSLRAGALVEEAEEEEEEEEGDKVAWTCAWSPLPTVVPIPSLD